MDNPYIFIALLVVLLVVLLFIKKKQKVAAAGNSSTKKNGSSANQSKPKQSSSKRSTKSYANLHNRAKHQNITATPKKSVVAPNKATQNSTLSANWNWQEDIPPTNNNNTVSIEAVDPLTEYKVYKQFGYFQKAAESLSSYLIENSHTLSADIQTLIVKDLADLCLQANNIDMLSDVLNVYHTSLNKADQKRFIQDALAKDTNHLNMRLLAQQLLDTESLPANTPANTPDYLAAAPSATINTTNTNPETKQEQQIIAPVEARELSAPRNQPTINVQQNPSPLYTTQEITPPSNQHSEKNRDPLPLIKGNGVDGLPFNNEEKSALISFSKPERSYRLLKNQLSYHDAIDLLDQAIEQTDKPAELLIEALTLDHNHAKIDAFARHLWLLYDHLGENGQRIKERMLLWGSNLGKHDIFNALEKQPNAAELRNIGVEKGYIKAAPNTLTANRHSLIATQVDQLNESTRAPVESILAEADSLLEYGQLDATLTLLEKAITQHPQESQLYITLLDLYERSENWARLQKMLIAIRDTQRTLPEEVLLAISKVVQRIKQGNIRRS